MASSERPPRLSSKIGTVRSTKVSIPHAAAYNVDQTLPDAAQVHQESKSKAVPSPHALPLVAVYERWTEGMVGSEGLRAALRIISI